MLDQNTDRMWYVIGAVLVGAAIILIANGALPDVFASVADSFEDASENAMEVVEDLKPNTRANLLSQYEHIEMQGGHKLRLDGTVVKSGGDEFLRFANIEDIIETYGPEQTYTLSFDMKSLDTSNYDKVRVYMQNGNVSKYSMGAHYFPVTTEYQHYVFEGIHFQKADDVEDAYLAFFGGVTNDDYGNGNVPVVKNVRLVLE